jgi:hypothetical protein
MEFKCYNILTTAINVYFASYMKRLFLYMVLGIVLATQNLQTHDYLLYTQSTVVLLELIQKLLVYIITLIP